MRPLFCTACLVALSPLTCKCKPQADVNGRSPHSPKRRYHISRLLVQEAFPGASALREHCLDRLLGVGHRPGCPKQLGSKATQQHRWHTGSTESKSFVSCPYHPLQLLLCFFHKRICLASLASHSILPSLPDDLLESLNIPPAGCAENYAAPNSMERRL